VGSINADRGFAREGSALRFLDAFDGGRQQTGDRERTGFRASRVMNARVCLERRQSRGIVDNRDEVMAEHWDGQHGSAPHYDEGNDAGDNAFE
jgi:hypothetical protein